MAAKNFTLVRSSVDDELEMSDQQYIESLERAVDDLTDVTGKLTRQLGVAHRDLKKERERRVALEVELLHHSR